MKGSYHDMIIEAIANLNERTGSSHQAIKNYIATNYKIDPQTPYINRYIKLGVDSGELKQVKRSFKLNYDIKKKLIDKLLVKKKKCLKLKPSLLKDANKKSLPIKQMIQDAMAESKESHTLDHVVDTLKRKHKLTKQHVPSIKAIFTKNLGTLWKEDFIENDVPYYKAISKTSKKNVSFDSSSDC